MDTQREQRQAIMDALITQGYEVIYGKGGFWLRGHGHVTFAKARRMSGVTVPDALKREPATEYSAYGDWAIVAKINGIR
jgi:hypothetical protein